MAQLPQGTGSGIDHKEHVRALFARFDAKGSGKIEREDLVRVLTSLDPGYWSSDKISHLMSSADADHDQGIDLDEFCGWLWSQDHGDQQIALCRTLSEEVPENPMLTAECPDAFGRRTMREESHGARSHHDDSGHRADRDAHGRHDSDWPTLSSRGYRVLKKGWAESVAESAHDADVWRQDFKDAGDGTPHANMPEIRQLRKIIWLQTSKAIECSLRGQAAQPGRPPLDLTHGKTELLFDASFDHDGRGRPRVEIIENDMLEEAGNLARDGYRVAVLNMACQGQPGGGFLHGAGAQEENLHRRSDCERFTCRQRKGKYPIPDRACLVSPEVTIFRGTEADGYPFIDEPFHATVVSCAALQHPHLKKTGPTSGLRYAKSADHDLMVLKARLIIAAAVKTRCTAVILSAFGCGAFGNPPELVAGIFREELARSPLEFVRFCIFNDHNAGRKHNPRGNFIPFVEAFRDFNEGAGDAAPGSSAHASAAHTPGAPAAGAGDAAGPAPASTPASTAAAAVTAPVGLAGAPAGVGASSGAAAGAAAPASPAPAGVVLTPQPEAEARIHVLLDLAKNQNWEEIFKMLKETPGMFVNMRPPVRKYALIHHACYQEAYKIIVALVDDFDANPNLLSRDKQTPLQVLSEPSKTDAMPMTKMQKDSMKCWLGKRAAGDKDTAPPASGSLL